MHQSAATLAMLDNVDDADHRALAADALAAIARMEGTVNDVLDFRKLDACLFEMTPSMVRLVTTDPADVFPCCLD